MVRIIFITGGVLSGLGKGVAAASIGKILQFRGYTVDMMKIDPYLNVDPGTLNPIEHGEVFVCEEVWKFEPVPGYIYNIAEVDQDFGTYERFLDINMHPQNNITSGQVYLAIVLKERFGDFLGKTVQVIPHVTDEIKKRILRAVKRKNPDVFIIEVGGTVGDIETMPYLEAIRQLRIELGKNNTVLIHVTLVPYLDTVGQHKTKPTQHSVRTLQSMGLQPDIIIARSNTILPEDIKEKISLFSNVSREAVISDPDIGTIYELPLIFEQQNLGSLLCRLLNLEDSLHIDKLKEWEGVVNRFKNPSRIIDIAVVGKYCKIVDSYISINEALKHAAAYYNSKVKLHFLESEMFEEDSRKLSILSNYDGILLTPGFGERGTEGMIGSARYAIKNKIPFLGICFGAQLLFIAFVREYLKLEEANSTEINPYTPHPVVDLLEEQRGLKSKGGTMMLGSMKILLKKNTKLYEAYRSEIIYERFRHRYNINPEYARKCEEHGLVISAYTEGGYIAGIELRDGWIVGVQFHPEFKSRPNRPSPIYLQYIMNAIKYSEDKKTGKHKLSTH
ncbi:MAG: CTP synthase [Nitrososphaerota archaeon]